MLLLVAGIPSAVLGAVVASAAYAERQRRALRRCPVCDSRAMHRVLPRPPYDDARYRRVAIAYRCSQCNAQLFELMRDRSVGPLTGDQLDVRLAATMLPSATLRRR